MTRFEHTEYFWYLWALLPLTFAFIGYLWWRSKSLKKFGSSTLVKKLAPELPKYKHQLKFFFNVSILVLIVLGMANLQIGASYEKVKREGVDIMIALDVSNSMNAEDIKPSRLDRAKLFLSTFIRQLASDRVGIIIFAGKAYLQMPITSDYAAAKMYLNTIDTELVPTQGTAIGEAIRMATDAFDDVSKNNKVLIIITDGENHEGDAIDAIKAAKEQNILVHTLGVGSTKGAPIPVYSGSRQIDYKRDNQNNIVLSKLNEIMLQQVASAGDGEYMRLTNGKEETRKIMRSLEKLETQEFEEKVFTDYQDWFQLFLLPALLLLFIDFMIGERRSFFLKKLNLYDD
ncbi:MAG: VWA domain-containing protein [Chitinophagales bacterium]|nr:VWA domain-containing protein [Chitinophagales bacterium]